MFGSGGSGFVLASAPHSCSVIIYELKVTCRWRNYHSIKQSCPRFLCQEATTLRGDDSSQPPVCVKSVQFQDLMNFLWDDAFLSWLSTSPFHDTKAARVEMRQWWTGKRRRVRDILRPVALRFPGHIQRVRAEREWKDAAPPSEMVFLAWRILRPYIDNTVLRTAIRFRYDCVLQSCFWKLLQSKEINFGRWYLV